MTKYKTLKSYEHEGKMLDVGAEVEMDEHRATRLVEDGTLELVV